MQFTREECAHLTNVLLDYVARPDHLKETTFVMGRSQVTTKNVMAKAVEGSLSRDPQEPVTAPEVLEAMLRAAGVFMNDRQRDRALSELQTHFPEVSVSVEMSGGRRHYDDPTTSLFGETMGGDRAALPAPKRKRRITKRRK